EDKPSDDGVLGLYSAGITGASNPRRQPERVTNAVYKSKQSLRSSPLFQSSAEGGGIS
ncbi:unnamed protein product, partial [Heterosigma akashiwo]